MVVVPCFELIFQGRVVSDVMIIVFLFIYTRFGVFTGRLFQLDKQCQLLAQTTFYSYRLIYVEYLKYLFRLYDGNTFSRG